MSYGHATQDIGVPIALRLEYGHRNLDGFILDSRLKGRFVCHLRFTEAEYSFHEDCISRSLFVPFLYWRTFNVRTLGTRGCEPHVLYRRHPDDAPNVRTATLPRARMSIFRLELSGVNHTNRQWSLGTDRLGPQWASFQLPWAKTVVTIEWSAEAVPRRDYVSSRRPLGPQLPGCSDLGA